MAKYVAQGKQCLAGHRGKHKTKSLQIKSSAATSEAANLCCGEPAAIKTSDQEIVQMQRNKQPTTAPLPLIRTAQGCSTPRMTDLLLRMRLFNKR